MENIILQAQKLGLWRPLDIHFAHLMVALSHSTDALFLASACLSADVGMGHVCLPLSLLTPDTLFEGLHPKLAQQAWQQAGSLQLNDWQNLLLTSPSVSDGSRSTPLVLDKQQLYLHRLWQDECTVAHFFQRSMLVPYDENIVRNILNALFPTTNNSINWQKIAIALALTSKVSLISYRTSNDKNTMITKLLAAILQINKSEYLHIIIAAPTSKVTAQLTDYIARSMMILTHDYLRYKITYQVINLYKLLGTQPNSRRIQYYCDNPLYLDILILDESSIVDLPMMANLINALPAQARVIFLGNDDQFISVDTGTVFSDIFQLIDHGYSIKRCQELSRLTGYQLSNNRTNNMFSYQVTDSLCLLQNNNSLKDSSGISILANMINTGNNNDALILLNSSKYADIYYIQRHCELDYQRMVHDCVTNYSNYLQLLNAGESPASIIEEFNRYRLLSMLRKGKFGVVCLNHCIEQTLIYYGLLKKNSSTYAGQPIILLHDIQSLGLYNGDIGLILSESKNNKLHAYFILPNNSIKVVATSYLPKYATAFAITVYQSQELKFTHAALVLPDEICSPIFTRELLYAGVTKARKFLSIYAPDNEILADIITHPTQRRSGLTDRLRRMME
ncbi:MAG: exodeoxyribonuclease V subunit alpha [Candidatus Baumannia cicadellinicola]|nr:exodeoxyribonuclease V subunit alpha [Candidatus Baumannia cicadellinicola]MCJ7463013.1 exodeoxyribonuclease V subunit alpha [Candidatus Baumannia cicadellinicola]